MKFKEMFPELNENQIKVLKRELLAIVGEQENANVIAALYLRKVPEADSIELAVVHDRVESANREKARIAKAVKEYLQ